MSKLNLRRKPDGIHSYVAPIDMKKKLVEEMKDPDFRYEYQSLQILVPSMPFVRHPGASALVPLTILVESTTCATLYESKRL